MLSFHGRYMRALVLIVLLYSLVLGRDVMAFVDAGRVFSDKKVSALANAAQRGELKAMADLIRDGADVNLRGDQGYTPIVFTLFTESTGALELLLKAGARTNVRQDDGATPLWWAMQKNSTDFARMLLAAGADPNFPGKDDQALIQSAISNKAHGQLDLLLAAGANPSGISYGGSYMMNALAVNEPKMALNLLVANADFTFVNEGGVNLMSKMCRKKDQYLNNPMRSEDFKALWLALEKKGAHFSCTKPF